MRIISDFRDYYDTAMGYGVDYDTIWLRKEKKLEQGELMIRQEDNRSRRRWPGGLRLPTDLDLDYHAHTIGFCGKIYGCLVLTKPGLEGPNRSRKFPVGLDPKPKKTICYTIEETDAFVEANYKKSGIEYYYSKNKINRWNDSSRKRYLPATRDSFLFFWSRIKEIHENEEFFIKNNTPIFIDNKINAKLEDLEFYRVFDPYTAFQEIQMFFGRLRSPEKPIPEISNPDMIEAKGFDLKSSFRKEPSKKRKNKKK